MDFKSYGFVVICKEPNENEGYFSSKVDDGFLTTEIEDAKIFKSEKDIEEFISDYDDPDIYTYKPIEITYRIKNLKLL